MKSKWIAVWLALLASVCVSGPAGAARSAREQLMPAFAFNSNQEVQSFLITWVEDRGGGPDIYAKRLFITGLPEGGPGKGGWQIIRDNSAFNHKAELHGPRSDPSLIYNATREEFLLVYSEDRGPVDGWDVYDVRISSAGFSTGQPRLIAGGPGDQRHPDVSLTEDNGYLVVLDDNARDLDEIWARRLQANSIPKGPPYVLIRQVWNVSDPTTNGASVAWVDDRKGQTDIYSRRLKNGLPNGEEILVAREVEDEFAPRYGQGGLVWNVYNPTTGIDIVGAEVYQNERTRGGNVGIVVPAADQSWPDFDNGVVIFSDNRSGGFNLYGIRTAGGVRVRGREFAILIDDDLP